MGRLKALIKNRSKKLVMFLEMLEKESSESKKKDETLEILQHQVAELREKIRSLGRYKLSCHILKCRMSLLDQTTRDMLLQVDHRGRPLIM